MCKRNSPDKNKSSMGRLRKTPHIKINLKKKIKKIKREKEREAERERERRRKKNHTHKKIITVWDA